jgi:hypothetical protein
MPGLKWLEVSRTSKELQTYSTLGLADNARAARSGRCQVRPGLISAAFPK